jgi:hypothetical protein
LEASLPTYVASGAQGGVPNGGAATATLPAGVQENDYLILQFGSYHTVGNITASNLPAGWEEILEQDPIPVFAYNKRITIFGKFAGPAETNASLTLPTGVNHIGWRMHALRGVYKHDAVDAISSAADQGVALSCPSITTTGPNRLLVGFSGIDTCSAYTNANLSNILERTDGVNGDTGMCMFTAERAAAGAIGATTWNGPNSDGIAVGMVALRPA